MTAEVGNEGPPSLLRRILRWTLIVSLVLFVAGVGLLILRPEAMLFHPTPGVGASPEQDIGWAEEELRVETEDGEILAGWFLPGEADRPLSDQHAVVLYCHGNAGNIGHRMSALSGLRGLGASVLIFDYRGYGDSSGRPTVPGTRLDIQAVWAELLARGYAPGEIVLWGRSLGGAVAIDQAARASRAGTPPRALIVESSFTSTTDIGAEVYPWLPVRWLGAKLEYPSRELLAEVAAPVLVAHSPSDDLIPFAHGRRLLAAADEGEATRVDFVELEGGHNQGHLTRPRHLDAVVEFLNLP